MIKIFVSLSLGFTLASTLPAFAACDLSTPEARTALNQKRKQALIELYLRRGRALAASEKGATVEMDTGDNPEKERSLKTQIEMIEQHKKLIFGVHSNDPTIPCGDDVIRSCKDESSFTGGLHGKTAGSDDESTAECRKAIATLAKECKLGMASIVGLSESLPNQEMTRMLNAYYLQFDNFVATQNPEHGRPTANQGLDRDVAVANEFREKLSDVDYWIKGSDVCRQTYEPPYIYNRKHAKACDAGRPNPASKDCDLSSPIETMQYNSNRVEGMMRLYEEFSQRMRSQVNTRVRKANQTSAVANYEADAFLKLEMSARKALNSIPKEDSDKLTAQMRISINQLTDWYEKVDPRPQQGRQHELEQDKAYLKNLSENVDNIDYWMAGHVLCQKVIPAPYSVTLNRSADCPKTDAKSDERSSPKPRVNSAPATQI